VAALLVNEFFREKQLFTHVAKDDKNNLAGSMDEVLCPHVHMINVFVKIYL